jgi:hypothetical protein
MRDRSASRTKINKRFFLPMLSIEKLFAAK